MSDTATHTRGAESPLHPITGEPPGIKEILERRTQEGPAPIEQREPPKDPPRQDDDAEQAAREVAALRNRATEAEAGRQEAERRAAQAEQGRIAALQGAEDTGFTAINTALASATREKESLTAEMKTAGEAGDFGRIAEISARLGELGAEIRDLSQGKSQFEQDRQNRLNAPQRQQDRPGPVADTAAERQLLAQLGVPSRDAFLGTRTPDTAAWLRQHPEFFTDPAANSRIRGADALAEGRGIQKDTPAYFKFLEENALSQTTTPPRRETTERSVTPGAGPSREAPAPTGVRTQAGDVYVSAEQKTTAAWMGVDPVEYAREEAELRRSGALPHRGR